MSARVELLTDRLVLRPIRKADEAAFVDAWERSRTHLSPWLPRQWSAIPAAEVFGNYRRQQRIAERDGGAFRRLAATHDGSLVGIINLTNIVRGPLQCAFAGWNVFADQTRRGYATEALGRLLVHAFDDRGLALHRVQANVIPTNTPSLGLAAKVGFRREGLAKRYLEIDGTWQDHIMFARLADE